jgi:hypothetical protein
VSRIPEIADTMATGQRCYVEKDSTRPRKDHLINVILPQGGQARGRLQGFESLPVRQLL